MPRKNIEPIGYLKYKLKLKEGGTGLPVSIQVNSLEQADKIRELRLNMDNGIVEHTDFKVVDLNKKKVLWDYSKTAEQQRRTMPAGKKQQRQQTNKQKL